MAISDLNPQPFGPTAQTQLPAIDFYTYALSQLPQVYQNAANFCTVLKNSSARKQYLYDVIRSLVNSYNLNDTLATTDPVTKISTDEAEPLGIYANMIASVFNAPYSISFSDKQILNATQNAVNFVNSRGTPSDFYNYFVLNGLESYFTNVNVQDNGNATIFFNVPVANNPTNPPNPYYEFTTNMLRLKGAGIEVIVNGANIPFFQYGSLPSDNPPYEVAPGNAGFGIIQAHNDVINGGFYQSL